MTAEPGATRSAANPQPRWGNCERNLKGQAIVDTLRLALGSRLQARHWLDIGCGSGGIARQLVQDVDSVVGVDPESWPQWPDMCSNEPRLSFIVARLDTEQIPLNPGSFDAIVCNQVYEHVLDPQQLIINISRLLAPGGVCYFAGPNLLWPIEPHVYWPFVHWLPRRLALAVMRTAGSARAHELDAFSRASWTLEKWFRSAGLDASPAFNLRAAAQPGSRATDRMVRALSRCPSWAYRVMNPLVPGFVYILSKPGAV